MKTNNCLYLTVLLILSACTTKTPSNETAEQKQDTLSENISLKLPADTAIIDTVATPPAPHSEKMATFEPPVIVACGEEIEPTLFCSFPDTVRQSSESKKPFMVVEEMPIFPGGDSAMFKFISENLKYPNSESCIQGRVVLRFIVDKEGDIKDVTILRSLHPEFDKEAIRVIKSMPKWNVGKQEGIPVDVYYTLPILFRISK